MNVGSRTLSGLHPRFHSFPYVQSCGDLWTNRREISPPDRSIAAAAHSSSRNRPNSPVDHVDAGRHNKQSRPTHAAMASLHEGTKNAGNSRSLRRRQDLMPLAVWALLLCARSRRDSSLAKSQLTCTDVWPAPRMLSDTATCRETTLPRCRRTCSRDARTFRCCEFCKTINCGEGGSVRLRPSFPR